MDNNLQFNILYAVYCPFLILRVLEIHQIFKSSPRTLLYLEHTDEMVLTSKVLYTEYPCGGS